MLHGRAGPRKPLPVHPPKRPSPLAPAPPRAQGKVRTAEQLHALEEASFAAWRAGLEAAAGGAAGAGRLSFYETRLEFWRQLWRTLEMSDALCVVVDARCGRGAAPGGGRCRGGGGGGGGAPAPPWLAHARLACRHCVATGGAASPAAAPASIDAYTYTPTPRLAAPPLLRACAPRPPAHPTAPVPPPTPHPPPPAPLPQQPAPPLPRGAVPPRDRRPRAAAAAAPEQV